VTVSHPPHGGTTSGGTDGEACVGHVALRLGD
jgi:hypothetical protein